MGKDSVEDKERSGRRRSRRPTTGVADWATANAELLVRAVCAASITGGALRFGYSRDGGAYAIGVYGDGEPYTDFVSSAENIDDTLVYYLELFNDLGGTSLGTTMPSEVKKQGKEA